MTYDAMRVLLRVALIKRALFDIYVETCRAQHVTRKNLLSNIHFSEIMADTAHAYDVVGRLYTRLDEWRGVHSAQLQIPPADAPLDLVTIAGFVSRISTQVDSDAAVFGSFPGTGSVGDCEWARTPKSGHLDERPWLDDVASDERESNSDECFDPPSEDDLDTDIDDNDSADDDYPYHDSSLGVSDADAFDVFMGWNMASHHQHDAHERDDFACGDLSPALRDACHHELTTQEYQLLFGLLLPPTPRYKIDIFGNPIIPPQTGDEDSPDYNIPGEPRT